MESGKGLKIVVIGAVACGPKTASRLKRLMPEAEITVLERGEHVSFGACGIPYYVEGLFNNLSALVETPVGVPRTPVFFEKVKGVKVLTKTEAIKIDRESKTVVVRDLRSGEEYSLPYDKLVLATGATAVRPPIPGIDKRNVFFVRNLDDAQNIRNLIDQGKAKNVVIVGGGYIGIEMAEAFAEVGLNVSIV